MVFGKIRDLKVKPRIGFEETLVSRLAIETDLSIRSDIRGRDQGLVEQHDELLVEIVDDRAREHPVERIAADDQQSRDPRRRDDDHSPGQRPGSPALLQRAQRNILFGPHRCIWSFCLYQCEPRHNHDSQR